MEETLNQNAEELKKTKQKYIKIRNILLIGILIVIVGLLIIFTKRFLILNKIMKANICADLGNNYRITEYVNEKESMVIYYKDGVCKIGNIESGSYFYISKDAQYFIMDNEIGKQYTKIKVGENYDPSKVYLFDFSNLQFEGENKEISTLDIIKYTVTTNVKIDKEKYRDKEYITLQTGANKLFANPDNYYIEKNLYSGQINERIIEKDVVTNEEMNLPNLAEFEEY